MSDVTPGRVPEMTLGDRMRLALGARTTQAIADDLGVRRLTVSRWINDNYVPPRGMLVAWATLTDVDLDWLLTGQAKTQDSELSEAS